MHTREISFGGKTLTLETGRIAKQADGAVIVRLGGEDESVPLEPCVQGSVRAEFHDGDAQWVPARPAPTEARGRLLEELFCGEGVSLIDHVKVGVPFERKGALMNGH